MTDIEEKLGATLSAAAQDAPDAIGLAAGARRRQRVRRQRRIAVGGVAVALVVAASAVTLGTGGGDDVADDPTPTPSDAWQTITHGDARAAVPGDWGSHFCADTPTWAPPDIDPCSVGGGVVFVDETDDLAAGAVVEGPAPGSWVGTTTAGSSYLNVTTSSADLTRQILATARLEGQPVVDASQWVSFNRGVIDYEIPAWWGVGEDGDRSSYSTCVAVDRTSIGLRFDEQVDPETYVLARPYSGMAVTVTAPTQAVAQLVMATVVHHPMISRMDECAPEDFNLGLLPPESSGGGVVEEVELALDVVEFDGIVLEVPAGWSRKEDCGPIVQFSPGEACTDAEAGEGVRFLDAATFRPAMAEGEIMQSADGARLWGGFVLRDEYAVFVTNPDKAVAELLLSKVRP